MKIAGIMTMLALTVAGALQPSAKLAEASAPEVIGFVPGNFPPAHGNAAAREEDDCG